jgi:hypothetical protein
MISCTTSLPPGSGTHLLETELLIQADRLVGGRAALLVIDDTRWGVAAQYASALGKTANCQAMVSLMLARIAHEVPVMLALRLFRELDEQSGRLERAGLPADYRTAAPSRMRTLIGRSRLVYVSAACWRMQGMG